MPPSCAAGTADGRRTLAEGVAGQAEEDRAACRTSITGCGRGCSSSDVRRKQPKVYRQWQEQPENVCPPDGEMLSQADERVRTAMIKLLKRHKEGVIGLVLPEPLATLVRHFIKQDELGDLWKAIGEPSAIGRSWRSSPPQVTDPKQLRSHAMSASNPDPTKWKNLVKHPKRGVPEGLWKRCPGCEATIFRKEAEKRLGVCPECDYHWYVPARQRIRQVLDEGTFEEWDADLEPADPLEFVDKTPYARSSKKNSGAPG